MGLLVLFKNPPLQYLELNCERMFERVSDLHKIWKTNRRALLLDSLGSSHCPASFSYRNVITGPNGTSPQNGGRSGRREPGWTGHRCEDHGQIRLQGNFLFAFM